jgi:hypothetical protein
MTNDRFNALTLLFVHKDIELDIDAVIDLYARKHPRRMILLDRDVVSVSKLSASRRSRDVFLERLDRSRLVS